MKSPPLSSNAGSLFLLIALCFFRLPPFCGAEDIRELGEQAFHEARACVSAADFSGAVKALQLALRCDFVNKKYVAELRTVREIIKLREELEREADSFRWNVLALYLRDYYQRNRVMDDLVDICLRIFDRSKLTWNAVCAIDAMILAERFDDALDFVASVDEKGTNPSIQIAKGYILHSADRASEARQQARSISTSAMQTPDDLLRLARLQATTELYASSVKTLVRCFELTPRNSLAEFKESVVKLPEFEPLLASSEFAEALTTRSKLESTDRSCSQKWVGVVFDQRPKYIRDLSKGPINPDDWKIK